jgi:hypothetical protein
MVEERKNDRSIEIVDGEGRRFDAVSLTNKSQEQAKGIPVGRESPGAGMFLIEQDARRRRPAPSPPRARTALSSRTLLVRK